MGAYLHPLSITTSFCSRNLAMQLGILNDNVLDVFLDIDIFIYFFPLLPILLRFTQLLSCFFSSFRRDGIGSQAQNIWRPRANFGVISVDLISDGLGDPIGPGSSCSKYSWSILLECLQILGRDGVSLNLNNLQLIIQRIFFPHVLLLKILKGFRLHHDNGFEQLVGTFGLRFLALNLLLLLLSLLCLRQLWLPDIWFRFNFDSTL